METTLNPAITTTDIGGKPTVPPAGDLLSQASIFKNDATVTVKSGDTLGDIAETAVFNKLLSSNSKYVPTDGEIENKINALIEEIKVLNGLSSDHIEPGQVLDLPTSYITPTSIDLPSLPAELFNKF